MNALFYDIYLSYEENYDLGPIALEKLQKPPFKITRKSSKFLGFSVNLPFGIPAGPLLNSKFVKAAFDFGFAVSTYKTVRSRSFPSHPHPNILFVDAPLKLFPDETAQLTALLRGNKPIDKISITNSFGVPSQSPEIWQKDVKKALSYVKTGQLLILSFMGTVKKDQTPQKFVEDFALAAKLSAETGVKILEVNLSCPNIGNEGLVCYDLEMTKKICKAIRKAIGNKLLILKVGYFNNKENLLKLAKIVNEYAYAVAAINTIAVEIVDGQGNQALPGKTRLKSGVCGASIKWAGIEMVKKLDKIRRENNYKFEIIGIGGVMTPKDYFEYRNAGADIVQSATGAMWNPYLASEI